MQYAPYIRGLWKVVLWFLRITIWRPIRNIRKNKIPKRKSRLKRTSFPKIQKLSKSSINSHRELRWKIVIQLITISSHFDTWNLAHQSWEIPWRNTVSSNYDYMHKRVKLGIIGIIVIIIGVSVFYLTSPLFISTEIDGSLPEGVELSPPFAWFQEFMALNGEERIEAGNQMDEQERIQIMFDFSKMNTSIDESMQQRLKEQGCVKRS